MSEAVKKVIGEELYSQISEKLGEGQDLMLNDGSYIPKTRFSEVNEAKRQMEAELTTLKSEKTEIEKTLEALKSDAETSKATKEQLSLMEQALVKVKEDSDKMVAQLKKEHTFDLSVNALKPKNLKAVKALFDIDKVSVDGENLVGFQDQAERIKAENPYLFEDEKKSPFEGGDDAKGKKKDMQQTNPWEDGTKNIYEQVMLKRQNPELANKLQAEAARKREQAKLKKS